MVWKVSVDTGVQSPPLHLPSLLQRWLQPRGIGSSGAPAPAPAAPGALCPALLGALLCDRLDPQGWHQEGRGGVL